MEKLFLNWEDCRIAVENNIVQPLKKMIKESIFDFGPIRIYGIPRGGIPVALLAVDALKDDVFEADIVDDPEKATVFVDDLVDSGKTKEYWEAKFPHVPFFPMICKSETPGWIVFPWEKGTEDNGPEENVRRLMEFIGEDVKREGLIETPKRVIKSYQKLFGGYKEDPASVMKTFTEGACDQIVLLKNIELYSTCEHHILPFFGKCHIAYIPNGKVIGVSKLARLMEIYARRMQIQERIGQQITSALEKFLEPLGAACIIEAQHFCMASRGVEKQKSVMVTSSLTGIFLKDVNARAELMNLIKN